MSTEARAMVIEQSGGPFIAQDVVLDDPIGNEVLVEVKACGVCHTDLLIRDQLYPTPLPVVLGHEGAGIVRAVGPEAEGFEVGDHVGMSFASCGVCPACVEGRIAYCWDHMPANFSGFRQGRTRNRGMPIYVSEWNRPSPIRGKDGPIAGAFFQQSSFATYSITTDRNLVLTKPDIPFEILAPMGCGFQTGAGAIFKSLDVKAGEPIVVTGAGAVGMAAIMAAKLVGAGPIIAVDIVQWRLDLALELGATHAINGRDTPDLTAELRKIVPSGMAYALECTGNPGVFRAAVDSLRPTGVAGLIAGAKGGTEVKFDMIHLLFGRTVKGILQGDSDLKGFLPELNDLYRQGVFPVDRLVRTYDLEDLNAAADDMEEGHTIKPVIVMQ